MPPPEYDHFLDRNIQNIHREKVELTFIGRKNSEYINYTFKQICFQKCTVLENLTESDAVERFKELLGFISMSLQGNFQLYLQPAIKLVVLTCLKFLEMPHIDKLHEDLTVFCSPDLLPVLAHSSTFRYLIWWYASHVSWNNWKKSQLNLTLSTDGSISSQRLQPL